VRRLGPGFRLETLRLRLQQLDLPFDRPGLVEPDRGVGREIVEDRGERDAQKRRDPLQAVEVDPFPDQIAEPAAVQPRGERGAVEGRDPRREILRIEKLARRRDPGRVHGARRALRRDLEGADRRDDVSVELDSHRVIEAGPVDVDDAATAAHFPRFSDLRHRAVPRDHQTAQECLGLRSPTGRDLDRAGTDGRRSGDQPMEGCGRDHRDRRVGVSQAEERVEPVVAHGDRRRLRAPGNDVERRQIDDAIFPEQKGEVIPPRLRPLDVGGDYGHRTLEISRKDGEEERGGAS
jgi:hypothetical protein